MSTVRTPRLAADVPTQRSRPPDARASPVETDPVTGEKKMLALDEKEKLYLECLDAFYNEGGKKLLSDDEYEQLKLDLDFEGSKVATYSKDEVLFVIANKYTKNSPPNTIGYAGGLDCPFPFRSARWTRCCVASGHEPAYHACYQQAATTTIASSWHPHHTAIASSWHPHHTGYQQATDGGHPCE